MGSEPLQMDRREGNVSELEGNALDGMGGLTLGGVDRNQNELTRRGLCAMGTDFWRRAHRLGPSGIFGKIL